MGYGPLVQTDGTTITTNAQGKLMIVAGGVGNSQISAGALIDLSKLAKPTITKFDLGNPATTASLVVAGVMLGLGAAGLTVTPSAARRGIIHITIRGIMANDTAGDGVGIITLRWGQGAAPANGAVAVGTIADQSTTDNWLERLNSGGAANQYEFEINSWIDMSGQIGVTNWIDLAFRAFTGGNAMVQAVTATVGEF